MTAKPYSPFQSPDDIIEVYGGDKLRIAEAMRLGIVDPTIGTLAGLKIDRTRAAATKEAAYKPSIAQQVMGGLPPAPPQAPPQPSGGLGATPQAGPPMAPQGGVGMAPPPAAPQQAVPGMAAGGMFDPPYMKGGGLSEIPLPDTMFDENRDGSYAHGGIVAFPTGGEVVENEDIEVMAREDPESIHGIYRDPILNKTEVIQKLYQPERKYSTKLADFYESVTSPEAQKKRKKEDMWASLAELGFGMAASKSPTLFGAIGEAGMRAAPAMAERGKERRAEQRDAIKTLAQQEGLNNKEALEVAKVAMDYTGKYADLAESGLNRKQQMVIEQLRDARERWQTLQQVGASMYNSREGASATRDAASAALQRDTIAATREASRYYDALTEESPALKRLKQTDPLKYTQQKTQYIRDYVYGPK